MGEYATPFDPLCEMLLDVVAQARSIRRPTTAASAASTTTLAAALAAASALLLVRVL